MSAQFFSPIKLNLPGFGTGRGKSNSSATAKEPTKKRKSNDAPLLLEAVAATAAVAAAALIPAATQDAVLYSNPLSFNGNHQEDDSVPPPEPIHEADEEGISPTDDDWIFQTGHPEESAEPPPPEN